MALIKDLKTGILYKNPKPHVKSLHAYFPSVAVLPDGEMVATVVLGEAFEAVNLRTHIFRSKDGGISWSHEGPLYEGTLERITSDCSRITALLDGELVVFMIRHDRTQYPDEGLTNPETLGFVPTQLLLFRSKDKGKTWIGPIPIEPPLTGPSFEMCSPITVISDGRWLIPTQTWPGWNGDCPNGIRMIALVSYDQGKTWPEYMDVMHESKGRVFFWESKIVELSDGRLVATAWAYDDMAKKDRPNQYAVSFDRGKTWSAPNSTGLLGQTLTPLVIDDNLLLCVYRRMDKPGLWVNLAQLDGSKWVNKAESPLWGHNVSGLTTTTTNMSYNFQRLRFGAPCIVRLKDDSVFVAFWCYEECVSIIRWYKFFIQR